MSTINHSLCISNFNKTCRICLITTDNSSANCFRELLNKLQYCIGIKLDEDVTLPSTFCGNCANTINVMYNFKELCIYSQQILSNIVKNELVDVKTDPTELTEDEETPVQQELPKTDNKSNLLAMLLDPLYINKKNINNSSLLGPSNNSVNNLKAAKPDLKTTKPDTAVFKIQYFRKRDFKCNKDWCNRYFRTASERDIHMQQHIIIPKEQRYQRCSFQDCKKVFLKRKYLIKHEKQHLKEEQCKICGITVPYLKQHMLQIHNDNKPYQCTQCTSKFEKEQYLRTHIRYVHEHKPKKRTLCEECGKTFPSLFKLREHINVHTGEKPYKCSKCPFAAKTKPELRKHINIRHNENRVKKFVCTFCNKKFGCNTTLKSHIRSHTGERPYACKLCDKRYTQRSSLRLHFKSHQLAVPVKTEMVKD